MIIIKLIISNVIKIRSNSTLTDLTNIFDLFLDCTPHVSDYCVNIKDEIIIDAHFVMCDAGDVNIRIPDPSVCPDTR